MIHSPNLTHTVPPALPSLVHPISCEARIIAIKFKLLKQEIPLVPVHASVIAAATACLRQVLIEAVRHAWIEVELWQRIVCEARRIETEIIRTASWVRMTRLPLH
jgi:hypothetical protein